MDQMRRYGIPASVTLAQGILESGSGQSELSRKGNSRYSLLFELAPDDYVGWTNGLQKAGYATNKSYAFLLQGGHHQVQRP